MAIKKPKIFLDTSVLFSAILSPGGGARKLFLLAETDVLKLVVGPTVLTECEEVVKRKAPNSLPRLAQLLAVARTETSLSPSKKHIVEARTYVRNLPDAYVLAEAIRARPDWFITHDKEHFLKKRRRIKLPFEIGTPGDFIQRFKDSLKVEC